MAYTQDPRDPLIQRGAYGFNTLGATVFVGLRAADVFLQYGILAKGLADPLLNYLNVSHVPNFAPLVAFGLPLQPLVILTMAAGTTVKQFYHALLIEREVLTPSSAVIISIVNTVFNSINSILSLTTAASAFMPSFLTTQHENSASNLLIISSISYLVGLSLEAVSETQRKAFKDDPKNAGKAYTGGLFGLARHINYGGYAIWRASYALASGGWIWGAFIGVFFTYDFVSRAIPVLDEYCSKRVSEICGVPFGSFADFLMQYGATWVEYKKKVPYKFLPGIL
jgi:protein-S-isoprenylcysteine O-methyltransferase Ste14